MDGENEERSRTRSEDKDIDNMTRDLALLTNQVENSCSDLEGICSIIHNWIPKLNLYSADFHDNGDQTTGLSDNIGDQMNGMSNSCGDQMTGLSNMIGEQMTSVSDMSCEQMTDLSNKIGEINNGVSDMSGEQMTGLSNMIGEQMTGLSYMSGDKMTGLSELVAKLKLLIDFVIQYWDQKINYDISDSFSEGTQTMIIPDFSVDKGSQSENIEDFSQSEREEMNSEMFTRNKQIEAMTVEMSETNLANIRNDVKLQSAYHKVFILEKRITEMTDEKAKTCFNQTILDVNEKPKENIQDHKRNTNLKVEDFTEIKMNTQLFRVLGEAEIKRNFVMEQLTNWEGQFRDMLEIERCKKKSNGGRFSV